MSLRLYKNPEEKAEIVVTAKAVLVMEKDTYDQIMYFLGSYDIECQWYSCIERLSTTDPDQYAYRVYDFFIPKQTTAKEEVESSPQEIQEMWQEIRTQRGLDTAALSELMKHGTFWGHSHHTMPPKPSKQDDTQWNEMKAKARKKTAKLPTGMIILNKDGKYTARLFDPELNFEIVNPTLVFNDPTDFSYVDEALSTKLIKKEVPPKTNTVIGAKTSTTSSSTGSSASHSGYSNTHFQAGDGTVTLEWPDQKKTSESLGQVWDQAYAVT